MVLRAHASNARGLMGEGREGKAFWDWRENRWRQTETPGDRTRDNNKRKSFFLGASHTGNPELYGRRVLQGLIR